MAQMNGHELVVDELEIKENAAQTETDAQRIAQFMQRGLLESLR